VQWKSIKKSDHLIEQARERKTTLNYLESLPEEKQVKYYIEQSNRGNKAKFGLKTLFNDLNTRKQIKATGRRDSNY